MADKAEKKKKDEDLTQEAAPAAAPEPEISAVEATAAPVEIEEAVAAPSAAEVVAPVEETAPAATASEPVQEPIITDVEFPEEEAATVSSKEVAIEDNGEHDPVTVRPVEFSSFDTYTPTDSDTNRNLEILMDIKLELTVELGRCQLPVKKVLELTRGSIIELDKVAGESVELYANGKHVANGEVVVIEDNFGLRITAISEPEERIKGLT